LNSVSIDDLIEIFAEVVDISRIRIDPDSVLGEDIPVDSKDMLRIFSRIEARYKFRFEPIEIFKAKTAGDVLKTVQRHVDQGRLK
jgi:acyl carrier protein